MFEVIATVIATSTPATMIETICGGFEVVPGHDVEIGDIVTCPDAGECAGCISTDGDTSVASVLRTSIVDLAAA